MTILTILGGLLVTILGLWAIIAAHRTKSRTAALLVVAIPMMLAVPFGLYHYGTSLLGYAVVEEPQEFALLHAYADDKRRVIVALVRLKGHDAPRLYEVTGNYDENRKSFGAASGRAAKGVPVGGRKRIGLKNDGSFEFYVLPAAGLPNKG